MAVRVIEGDYLNAIIFGFDPPFINDPEDGKVYLNKEFVESYEILEQDQHKEENKKKGFFALVGQKTKKGNKVIVHFKNGKQSVISMTDDVFDDFISQMK